MRSKEKESKTNEADLMMDNKKAEAVIADLQEQLGSVQYREEVLQGEFTKENLSKLEKVTK